MSQSSSRIVISIDNVKYVRLVSPYASGGNIFVLYELYLWGLEFDTTPPATPSNFRVTDLQNDRVALSWDENTEPDLQGYIVIRDGQAIARVVNMTTYTDYTVEPNRTYTYAVAAYDTSDLASPLSEPVTVTTLPSQPQIQVTVDGLTLHLTWSGEAETFKVLVNGQEVGETAEHSFDYMLPDYGTYSLQVVGVNASGEVVSDPVSLNVFPPLEKPVVRAAVDNRTVELTWTGNADSYRVLINGETVDETTEKSYIWTAPCAGKYVVQVIAVGEMEECASDPLTVSISSFTTPGAGQMSQDLLRYAGIVIAPMGSLIALALALTKGSPLIIDILKRWWSA